ncbi:MAG TPA: GNAT family N-acetyltransferase [Pyrinomonadaceae bacterium]|nr:GNAT family N-acetyltransferase [Pyrinomonadaceae bacterium]
MRVNPLTENEAPEALAFLAERPVDNVIMSGFMRDNGVVSRQNRGRFYGCWNRRGALEGVALVGHGMSFDSRTEAATELFAALARLSTESHLLMGESRQVQSFWNYYAPAGGAPRKLREVTILEQRRPFDGCRQVSGLRPALVEEAEQVAALHAQMVTEETGRDPLAAEPESFRSRCLRRIERGRTWVWPEGGRIVFKADVIAQTPEVAYVEGVYVRAAERGKGHGRRCLAQMGRELLKRVGAVCLFADEENPALRDFYRSVGYRPSSSYNILYF